MGHCTTNPCYSCTDGHGNAVECYSESLSLFLFFIVMLAAVAFCLVLYSGTQPMDADRRKGKYMVVEHHHYHHKDQDQIKDMQGASAFDITTPVKV